MPNLKFNFFPLQLSGLDGSTPQKTTVDEEEEESENPKSIEDIYPTSSVTNPTPSDANPTLSDANPTSSVADPTSSAADLTPSEVNPTPNDSNPTPIVPSPSRVIPMKQEAEENRSENKMSGHRSTTPEQVKTRFTSSARENLLRAVESIQQHNNRELGRVKDTGLNLDQVPDKPKKKLDSHELQSKRLISKVGLLDVFVDESSEKVSHVDYPHVDKPLDNNLQSNRLIRWRSGRYRTSQPAYRPLDNRPLGCLTQRTLSQRTVRLASLGGSGARRLRQCPLVLNNPKDGGGWPA